MSTSWFYRTAADRGPRNMRWSRILGTAGVAAVLVTAGIGVASAQTRTLAGTPTVNCPTVSDKLANVAIPASAQAEVTRNLALLTTQINEANNRLRTSVGQGGPNFIQNAILGPLADKRLATVNRIATAIGRQGTKPQGLGALATCTLNANGGTSATEPASIPAGNGGGAGGGAVAAAVPTVNCPTVSDKLANVAIPASAQAEVTSNLALLTTQINEANNRLRTSVGQGGPNFIQNAILGPLADKRLATVNRIATAIGRQGTKPEGLGALATCTLNAAGGTSSAEPANIPAGTTNAAGGGAVTQAARSINCPAVNVANVPAAAQAEVTRNLALLNTQISEANNRLATSVGQGGPAFVQNAILGPLSSKRGATLDRIRIAFNRQGATPPDLGGLANCTLNGG